MDKRWWASTTGDLSFVEQNGPGVGEVTLDQAEGRFRLLYPGFPRASVSWTTRGLNKASLTLLRQWWGFHKRATGSDAPEALQKLFSQ